MLASSGTSPWVRMVNQDRADLEYAAALAAESSQVKREKLKAARALGEAIRKLEIKQAWIDATCQIGALETKYNQDKAIRISKLLSGDMSCLTSIAPESLLAGHFWNAYAEVITKQIPGHTSKSLQHRTRDELVEIVTRSTLTQEEIYALEDAARNALWMNLSKELHESGVDLKVVKEWHELWQVNQRLGGKRPEASKPEVFGPHPAAYDDLALELFRAGHAVYEEQPYFARIEQTLVMPLGIKCLRKAWVPLYHYVGKKFGLPRLDYNDMSPSGCSVSLSFRNQVAGALGRFRMTEREYYQGKWELRRLEAQLQDAEGDVAIKIFGQLVGYVTGEVKVDSLLKPSSASRMLLYV